MPKRPNSPMLRPLEVISLKTKSEKSLLHALAKKVAAEGSSVRDMQQMIRNLFPVGDRRALLTKLKGTIEFRAHTDFERRREERRAKAHGVERCKYVSHKRPIVLNSLINKGERRCDLERANLRRDLGEVIFSSGYEAKVDYIRLLGPRCVRAVFVKRYTDTTGKITMILGCNRVILYHRSFKSSWHKLNPGHQARILHEAEVIASSLASITPRKVKVKKPQAVT